MQLKIKQYHRCLGERKKTELLYEWNVHPIFTGISGIIPLMPFLCFLSQIGPYVERL